MTAKKPKKSAPANAETPATLTVLPVDRLHPNEYNPNRMTEEEFAELQKEVEHLGRLPKPVVVRPNSDGYTIVDGEHGWRVAQAAGMCEVPCEVIDADDFEAMRQTYKRNQHGTHDPLLLGRMFRRMLETRNLSARALAEEIAVSEGTVRNAVLYAEAADMRNCYARARTRNFPDVARLSVRQVRCYLKLGGRVADLWLDAGADLRTIYATKEDRLPAERAEGQYDSDLEELRRLEGTGLFEFIPYVNHAEEFRKAVAKVQKWKVWEGRWLRCDIDAKEFRGYSRHFFEGNFYVRNEILMDGALAEILDAEVEPAAFILTAEEFEAILSRMGKAERESAADFEKRLSLAVAEKTGKPPRETKAWVQGRLWERQLESAPDYVRASRLNTEAKFALWQAEGPDEAKRELAGLPRLPLTKGEDDGTPDGYGACVCRLVNDWKRRQRLREEWEGNSERELAVEMARRFVLYDPREDAAAIGVLTDKLATLTKAELLFLVDHCKGLEFCKGIANALREMM